jgi:hypothetical protein
MDEEKPMILFGGKHLHVSETDQIVDRLFRIVGSFTSGSIKLEVASKSIMKVEINKDSPIGSDNKNRRTVVGLDLLESTFFSVTDDQTGLFDKLRTAAEFAQKLTDNRITFSLRKGKEAITLGEGARPSLSRIITKSDDIQLNSVKESVKLKTDFDDA